MGVFRKRGKWWLDFYNQNGTRRRKSLSKGTTKAGAQKQSGKILTQVERGVFITAKEVTLFKDVARDWFEYKRTNLRKITWEVYEGHARNHFHDLRHTYASLQIARGENIKYIQTQWDTQARL